MHHSVPIATLCLLLFAPAGPGPAQTLRLADAHFPSWSPDGTQIVCNRVQGAQSDAAGGDKVAFVKTLDDDFGPFDLWILDLETTVIRPVTWSEVKRAFR